MTDAHTRFLLKCQSVANLGLVATQRNCDVAFREFGVPERMRSDNRAPFSSVGLGGLSALSIWWIKLGITPERSAQGKPYQRLAAKSYPKTAKEGPHPVVCYPCVRFKVLPLI